MGKPTLNRVIIDGDELRTKVDSGIKKLYGVALAAYGCQSGNVLIERRASTPIISHDGVTNISELEVSDPIEDVTIKVIKQAAKRTNETAGDGTTLSTILSYHLYQWAKHKIDSGIPAREVVKMIKENQVNIVNAINDMKKKDVDDDTLLGVCKISAGDGAIANLVFDVMQSVGEFGGINVSYAGTSDIYSTTYGGMYIESGFSDPNLINDLSNTRSVFQDVPVVVIGRIISRQNEIIPVLEKLVTEKHNKAVFFADITGDALLVLEKNKQIFDACVVKPVFNNYERLQSDIALYTGGKVYYGDLTNFDTSYLGMARELIITNRDTTIIVDKKNPEVDNAVKELTEELYKTTDIHKKMAIEDRMARLTANIATIYVGGASETERIENKLKIDDTICAAKSALADGVLPGGGVALRDISKSLKLPYLANPYNDLIKSAGITAVEELSDGFGYNLMTGNLEHMIDSHIVDPTIVIREAVINSHSVVASLITTTKALVYEDRKWEF